MLSFGLLWLLLSLTPEITEVREVNLEQLQSEVIQPNDTLYVVNFWATWCKPCVEEMPYFETAGQKFSNKKVKLVFVSLNYARELQVVAKFIRTKKIKSKCLLLNAGNPNAWIDKVEKEWSGSIPATIMYRNGKEVFFHEGEFMQSEIDSIIQQKIQ